MPQSRTGEQSVVLPIMSSGPTTPQPGRGLDDVFMIAGLAELGVKAALDVAELLSMPTWLSVACYATGGASVVGAALYKWRAARRVARRERRRKLGRLLGLPNLPRVSEVGPYDGPVGVARSRYAVVGHDPYVPRAVDRELERLIADGRFVLVVGAMKAGKTRTAFEAVRRTLPSARLVVPHPGALRDLFDLDPPLAEEDGPLVLWLDDIDRFLGGPGEFTWPLLQRLRAYGPRVHVVGTLTAARRQHVYNETRHPSHDHASDLEARWVLEAARVVLLPRDLTPAELRAARRLYPGEDFRLGIGVRFVATWEYGRLAEDAPTSNPVGWTLVEAAVDWARSGTAQSCPRSWLYEAARRRLRDSGHPVPSREELAAGLAWAQEQPAESPVKALRRVSDEPEPSYEVFDYLVEYVGVGRLPTQRGAPPNRSRSGTRSGTEGGHGTLTT